MILHLGVADVAYSDPDAGGVTTTGDVAEILEAKYHIMRTFFELNEDKIQEYLVDALSGEIESLAQGKRVSMFGRDVKTNLGNKIISGMSVNGKIEEAFRDFLDRDEISKILPLSWQSQAAKAGVNHRKKRPYVQSNAARPAFIDTGLFQQSFRAWIE